jgi:hypothetical protein
LQDSSTSSHEVNQNNKIFDLVLNLNKLDEQKAEPMVAAHQVYKVSETKELRMMSAAMPRAPPHPESMFGGGGGARGGGRGGARGGARRGIQSNAMQVRSMKRARSSVTNSCDED